MVLFWQATSSTQATVQCGVLAVDRLGHIVQLLTLFDELQGLPSRRLGIDATTPASELQGCIRRVCGRPRTCAKPAAQKPVRSRHCASESSKFVCIAEPTIINDRWSAPAVPILDPAKSQAVRWRPGWVTAVGKRPSCTRTGDLFREDGMGRYIESVAAMPVSTATFRSGFQYGRGHATL